MKQVNFEHVPGVSYNLSFCGAWNSEFDYKNNAVYKFSREMKNQEGSKLPPTKIFPKSNLIKVFSLRSILCVIFLCFVTLTNPTSHLET